MAKWEADAVVIGGGLSGTSIAYHLARRGKKVVLVEKGGLAAGASGATFGWITVHFASYMAEYPDYHMKLMASALSAYEALARVFGDEIEYERTGGLSLAYSEEELAAQAALAARLNAAGIPAGIVSREELLQLEPALGGPFVGGLVSPQEALVNPLALVRTFAREAARHGALILTRTPVTGIETRKGEVTGVETPVGRISAPAVVNAAGLDAPAVASLAGVDVPVGPSRGQQLVVRARPGLVRGVVYGHGMVRRFGEGVYLVGGLREQDHEGVVTPQGIAELARRACELVPELAAGTVTRAFVGLRPVPGDGMPIWGPVRGLRGYLLAVLHFGVTLAPLTGHVVASYVLGEEPEVDVRRYLPDRFMSGAPAA